MKKAVIIGLLLVAMAAFLLWLAPWGGKASVMILKNTGTNSVFVRTSPPPKHARLAFTLRPWPPMAKPVPLNAVILNRGCVVTQQIAHGVRIEICTAIPSAKVFEAIERPDGVILTDGYAPITSNMPFQAVWRADVRRIEAEVNGDGPTNNLFRVVKLEE